MSKLIWDEAGKHFYETGVDHAILFVHNGSKYGDGVAWNGITAINESPSGAESNPIYADNIKYLNLLSAEDFGASIEAYTYPDAFANCDGSEIIEKALQVHQQARSKFGLYFRTKVGNDLNLETYKHHFVYNCLAAPSERAYATVNDSPEAITFSWEITTTPVEISDISYQVDNETVTKSFKPTAHLTIDESKITNDDAVTLGRVKDIIEQTEGRDADTINNIKSLDPTLKPPHDIIAYMLTGSWSE